QYPNGKWSQEARIRLENFELGAPAPAGDSLANRSVTAGTAGADNSGSGGGASTQPSAQVTPGEAAQLPTPGQTSPGAASVQSPRPPTYPVAAATPVPAAANVAAGAPAVGGPPGAPAAAATASTVATGATGPSSISSAWHSADPTSYGVQLGAFASENA